MLGGDRTDLGLGARLQRIGQDVNPQPCAAGVGRHNLREGLELLRHDDDRRRPPLGDHDRVVNAPRGA